MRSVLKLNLSLALAALIGCPVAVWLLIAEPLALAAVVGAMVAVLLISRPPGRLAFVVLGGLAAFQSSSGASAEKLVYLAGLVACAVIALSRLPAIFADGTFARVFGGPARASGLLLLYLLSTYFVAHRNGASGTSWLRDVITYFLFAVAPLVAIDAGSAMSPIWAVRFLAVGSALGAVAFSASWLQRRGVATGGIGHFMLASFALGIVGFCYALSRVVNPGPHRIGWAIYAIALFLLPLITGTRTTLVLLAALIGVVGSRAKCRANPFKVGAVALVGVAASIVALPLLAGSLIRDPTFLQDRYEDALSFLSSGGSGDQSYAERSLAYAYAHQTFNAHPLLGAGLGHLYPAVEPLAPPTLTLDTPLLVMSKFGIVGLLVIAMFCWTILVSLHRQRRIVGWSVESTTLRAAVVVWVCITPFGLIFEDKGFSLGLMLLLALFTAKLRTTTAVTPVLPPRIAAASGLTGPGQISATDAGLNESVEHEVDDDRSVV